MNKFQIVNTLILLMNLDESYKFKSKSELARELGVRWITDEMIEEALENVKN